jgi:hypothetical protein
MNSCKRAMTVLIAVIVLLGVSEVSAQWVFVARKALVRIERMTQPRTGDVLGYDVATVVIERKADKVYVTALKAIEAAPKFRITRQDPGERIIDFSDGTHAAGLKVSQVNDKVVHLLVASVVMPDQDSTTSLVLAGIMRVCKEVGASCSLAK